MALGATRIDVQRMVLRVAFLQVGLGPGIGILCAVEAEHLMAAELFGVDAVNPMALGTTIAVLGLSARQAAGVAEMEALRGSETRAAIRAAWIIAISG